MLLNYSIWSLPKGSKGQGGGGALRRVLPRISPEYDHLNHELIDASGLISIRHSFRKVGSVTETVDSLKPNRKLLVHGVLVNNRLSTQIHRDAIYKKI